ncbi:anti-sigma factor [Nodularia sp. UHCC 0506]|uniref:anti-sigma factor n=1 Tax=Nodularia sp. UHCC 0506 TaxID=3110243 RepID=UPI002B1FDC97|nr:anti-sigma factor [Nodularia sp. UHCC 0506]MEA5513556.1 anti-sigma factor [Nodularia sp. UHCC 0506]
MTNFPNFDELQELLAGYVLGDLTSEEVAMVNQLLETRPELKVEVNRLQNSLALLPWALPATSPPKYLGSQILQAAASSSNSIVSTSNRIWKKPPVWVGVLGSIAASVVISLSLYSYRLQKQVTITQAELSRYQETIALLRQPNNRLLTLTGTNVTPVASGSLVIAPKSDVALLTLQNLDQLPQGQIYRLWAVIDNKKVYCGEFNPDSQGTVFMQLPLDEFMTDSSQAVITIEPIEKVPQPTGETVMTGNVSL